MEIENRTLATFDVETDPFLHNRTPFPFCCGFYTELFYVEFWGDDCIDQFIVWLHAQPVTYLIYAHNGGKFDYHFFLRDGLLDNPLQLIQQRIAKAHIGKHQLRDSYLIYPMPLAAYKKDDFDYTKNEREVRETHKGEILKYLKSDCVYLYELVEKFLERFGARLTIGGTALAALRELHPFEQTDQAYDSQIRPYYFGGRVQCFDSGIIKGDFKVLDVNSMYPYVMKEYNHPLGDGDYMVIYDHDDIDPLINAQGELIADTAQPFFVCVRGINRGALPMRMENGSLSFVEPEGIFHTTSHELKTAIKYGLFDVVEYLELLTHGEYTNFGNFVDTYMAEKIEGKKLGDVVLTLHSKLILNSAYGKCGQNGENYKDYLITDEIEIPDLDEWDLEIFVSGQCFIWSRPALKTTYYDCAIAASVTGAARAVLLEALHKSDRPLYCDTDSIVCENLHGVELDPIKLGAWDIEGAGDEMCIAGKKVYALFNHGLPQKTASKGAHLSADEIRLVAGGETVLWNSDAPIFKLSGDVKFTHRNVKATG